jgi:hypothetical protein
MVFNFFLFRMIPGDPSELLLQGTIAFNPHNIEQVLLAGVRRQPLPARARDACRWATLPDGPRLASQGGA